MMMDDNNNNNSNNNPNDNHEKEVRSLVVVGSRTPERLGIIIKIRRLLRLTMIVSDK